RVRDRAGAGGGQDLLRGEGVPGVRRDRLPRPDGDRGAPRPVRPDPRADPGTPPRGGDQEGGQGGRDGLPARRRPGQGFRGMDDVEGSQQGDVRRMKIPFVKPVVPPHVFCLMQSGVTYGYVQRGQPAGIAFSQSFPYPPNTLGAGASGTPLFSAGALAPAVDAARRFAQGRLARASVVFPDSWARILPVEFDSLPGSPDAVREMVLWELKKLLPGITWELDLVYLEMAQAGEAKRLIAAAAPGGMLRSIEAAFEERGVRVGALAPASLVLFEGLAPLLASKSAGDYAILHRSSGSIAFLVARGETPILFRYRPMEEEEGHEQE